jgi:hypothetical protein
MAVIQASTEVKKGWIAFQGLPGANSDPISTNKPSVLLAPVFPASWHAV